MTDLFLSYKAEDRGSVARLAEALEADGLSVWWDAHIGGGDDWRDTILRHLEAAKVVIVVWSERSIGPNGQFVRDEATRALKRRTYFPVRIDQVDPPLGFGEMHALDLTGWKGDRSDPRYQAVISALRKRLGIKARRVAPTEDRTGIGRRAVIASGAAAAVAATGIGAWFVMKPGAAKANSIAVLPFANLSGDPAQAYFSDGIAEELRSALSRIPGLQVVARTSSEAVRDADATIAAAKLGVVNILTGSVRRSASMVRVAAQLIDGRQGLERWSEIYDRPAGDALQIQTDIANNVVHALSLELAGDARAVLTAGGTQSAEAQDLLLRARAAYEAGGAGSRDRAIGMVDSALAIDPRYGEAMATKSYLLLWRASRLPSAAEYRAGYAEAERYARRAVAVAPRMRYGRWALASLLDFGLNRRAALDEYVKMHALPGSDGRTLRSYALFLGEIGRANEALRLADRAIALDPLNYSSYVTKAFILSFLGRFPEAVQLARRALALAPQRNGIRNNIALWLMLQDKNDEARAEFARVPDDDVDKITWQAALDARTGRRAEAERGLARLRDISADALYYQQAEVLAQLGRKDEAIATLDRAWAVRDPGLTMMLVDPLMVPVRDDPRYRTIMARQNFP